MGGVTVATLYIIEAVLGVDCVDTLEHEPVGNAEGLRQACDSGSKCMGNKHEGLQVTNRILTLTDSLGRSVGR